MRVRDGIIVVNKPKGITSHDVVDFVRRRLGIKKVGHAGTLDPLATGVLLILLGRCTKLFDRFLDFDKEYAATITLGARTTTGDIEGKVVEEKGFGHVTEEAVIAAFRSYLGEILQVPPMVSALKHKGKPLYMLSRKGIEVERSPRKVTIKELRLLKFAPPHIQFYLKCSRGTYVRQLAEDIAKDLNTVGCISQIERQGVGPFDITKAVELSQVNEHCIQSYFF